MRFLTTLLAGPVEEAVRVLLVEHPELLDRPNSLYRHSLASKVLHWLMPWRVPIFDAFVRSEVGVPESWDLPDANRCVCQAVFANVREMADTDTAWMGSSDPQSLLHALDKWLWWAGGGKQGTAALVADPERVLRRLGLQPQPLDTQGPGWAPAHQSSERPSVRKTACHPQLVWRHWRRKDADRGLRLTASPRAAE